MQHDAQKPRWNLARGLVALIVTSVLGAMLYGAFTRVGHFGSLPSMLIAMPLALSLTGWLIKRSGAAASESPGAAQPSGRS